MNLIGNLTVLYNTQNSSIGNQLFANKIGTYKLCEFTITQTITKPKETTAKGGMQLTKIKKKIVIFININLIQMVIGINH